MLGRKNAKSAAAESLEDADLESLDASLAQTLGESEARAKPVPAEPSPAVLAQSATLLAKLRVGTWVEFAQGRDKKLRCKLAAVIASTGKHIFVNRSGVKVAEHGRDELVTMLATDQLVLLDDGLLFDRALESVISNLRDMKDKPI